MQLEYPHILQDQTFLSNLNTFQAQAHHNKLQVGNVKCFNIFTIGIMILANVLHTYFMIFPSEYWAYWSPILLSISAFHYGMFVVAVLMLCNEECYMRVICIRYTMVVLCYFTAIVYCILLLYLVYLVFFTVDWMQMVAAAYVSYLLIINVTILPQTLYIIFREGTTPTASLLNYQRGLVGQKEALYPRPLQS